MPQRILALEVDPQELKAAVLETTFRDYRIAGFYREAVNGSDGGLGEQVRAFLDRHQLQPTTVLSSLPGDLVTFRTFFLPFRDRKQLDQTVPFELENQVPFGLDEVIVDYYVLARDHSGCTVLAALVPRQDLEAHLEMLRVAGLDPKIVDLAPLATLNVLNLLGDERPATFVYVGGTMQRVTVALFRNQHLVGLRTLTVPVMGVDAASGNGHAASDADHSTALVAEIRWTLLALNGAPLDDDLPCIVGGAGAQFDELGRALAATLNLTTRRLDDATLRNLPPALRADVSNFVSPLGLALREVAPGDALGLNFRRGEFAYHRGQEEFRSALWRSGALAAMVLALVVADQYMSYQQLAGRLALVQAQIRSVFTQTLPDVHHITDEKVQIQGEVDSAQKRLQALAGIAPVGGVTAIDVMRTIATAIPDSIKIDTDEYVMDTDSVRLKARTESFEAVDTIKQQLVNTHYFSDVQVKDVKAAADGKVDFRLALALAKYGDAPAGTAAKP